MIQDGRATILIVDDSRTMRGMIKMALVEPSG